MKIIGLLLFGLVTVAAGIFRLDDIIYFLHVEKIPDKIIDARYIEWPVLSSIHIVTGTVYFLLGPFQFSAHIRSKWPAYHRFVGRVLLFLALVSVVSAISAAIVFPAFGGLLTTLSTIVVSVWISYCLLHGFTRVRSGDYQSHRNWMIRAFVVALGVTTIRFFLVAGEELFKLPIEQVFGFCFAAGFLVNVIFAEIYLRITKKAQGSYQ